MNNEILDQVLNLITSANNNISHEMTDETYCTITDKLCEASRLLKEARKELEND